MSETKLPSWASWRRGQVVVNIDEAYPIYLKQLKIDRTQYAAGVVKFCIIKDLQEITGKTEGIIMRFQGSDEWKNVNLPDGSDKQDPHGQGMRDGGKYRDLLIAERAALAFKAGMEG